MSEFAWEPSPEYVERANVTRLMRAHGIETIDELRARSVADISWYWDAVVRDLGIPFAQTYEQVLDDSQGIQWCKWFVGGRVNLTSACVGRGTGAPELADRRALIAEAENGAVRTLTYGDLAREVDALAAALRADGVSKGDTIGVFMPMVAEAVI